MKSERERLFDPSVFISYRRLDASGEARLIAERLATIYGEGDVFLDVVAISAGVNYERALERARQGARVMLSLIGARWMQPATDGGRRRLEDDLDPVRIEIQSALGRGIPLIPVLIQGASMPSGEDLPAAIRGLANIQATRLGHDTFDRDFAELQRVLDEALKSHTPIPAANGTAAVSEIQVGGTIAPGNAIYIERNSDFVLRRFLHAERGTLTLIGPRQFGKSSMLAREVVSARDRGRSVAFIDLSMIGNQNTFGQFVSSVAWSISKSVHRQLDADVFAQRPLSGLLDLFSSLHRRALIIIDEFDMLYGHERSELLVDLFKALQGMANGPSSNHSVLLCGVPMLGRVGFPGLSQPECTIQLEHFNEFESRLFLEHAQLNISDPDSAKLVELSGGHPYLLAIAARQVQRGANVNDLAEHAAGPDGLFGDHVRRMLIVLENEQGLLEDLRTFISKGGGETSESTSRQLSQLGVVKHRNGRFELAGDFYREAFDKSTGNNRLRRRIVT